MSSGCSCLVVLTIWLHLSTCWLPFSLGQTCISTSEDGNSSCSTSPKACRAVHTHKTQSFTECNSISAMGVDDISNMYYNYCDPGYRCSSKPVNEELLWNKRIEQMSIELHAVDFNFFSVNVSWHDAVNLTEGQGYEIRIKGSQDYECICTNSPNQHSVFIRGGYLYSFQLLYRVETNLTVDILPFPTQAQEEVVKMSREIKWPTSCLDVHHNSRTCGSPVLQPPANITATEVCDSPNNFTFDLHWDYDAGIFLPPSLYYIDVFSEQLIDDEPPLFRFVASRTTAVRIQLPASLDYNVTIQPYRNCSGIANYTNKPDFGIGCGIRSQIVLLERCPVPPPTTVTTTTSTSTSSAPTAEPNPARRKYFIVIGCSVGGFTLLLIIILVVVISLIALRYRKKLKPGGPILSPIDFSVFVVHAPKADAMRDVQTYIVCPLREFFDVVTSGDKMCGDVIEWIEAQVREKKAVLLVFTKEFCSEWEEDSDKSHVVRAAQRLLTSAVAQELLDKYAIVVLDEEAKENYIPDNHYLKSMSVYVLGRKKNEIDGLYRFVTKTKSFEHRERVSCSPISSVSLSEYTSQCTLSTGLNLDQCSSPSQCDLPLTKDDEDICNIIRTNNIAVSVPTTALPKELSNGSRPAVFRSEQNLTQQLLKVLDQPSHHLAGEDPCYDFV